MCIICELKKETEYIEETKEYVILINKKNLPMMILKKCKKQIENEHESDLVLTFWQIVNRYIGHVNFYIDCTTKEKYNHWHLYARKLI